MNKRLLLALLSLLLFTVSADARRQPKRSGNPIVPGWYADPEGAVFEGRYWVFPTYSALYEE